MFDIGLAFTNLILRGIAFFSRLIWNKSKNYLYDTIYYEIFSFEFT